ncbi:MAG: fibronectin type III domain-containing protein [Bacteroidetes bacterium]|nr:fibronectin type III domain-containing protein [Bacteroidota bacterium]
MKSKFFTLVLLFILAIAGDSSIAQNTNCPIPSGPVTTVVSTTSATVSWTAQTANGYYRVQYRALSLSSGTWTQMYAQTNSYTISGLLCGTAYEWQVQAICATIGGVANTSAFTTSLVFTTLPCNTTCLPPTGLNTSAIATNSAVANWTAQSGIGVYRIQYRPVTNVITAWTQITVQGTSYTMANLICGVAYEWQVQTLCSTAGTGGTSAYSSSTVFTTLTCPTTCPVPAGLTVSSITSTGATLSWTSASPAPAYYLIQYRPLNTVGWTSVTVQANQSYTLTGLSCNTAYEWKLQSICANSGTAGGSSAFSTPLSFTTSACPTPTCAVPTGLNSSAVSSTSVNLAWTAASGAIYYKIQYRPLNPANANWTQVYVTANSSYILSSLVCGTSYEWQVQSICSSASNGGSSAFSTSATFSTLACTSTCAVPSGMTTGNITSSSAVASWTAVAGVSIYNLQYRLVTNAITNWTQATVQGTTFSLANLMCGALYEWQVASVCTNTLNGTSVISSFSPSTTFTTLACATTCPVPSGLASGNITASSAYVGWAAVSGVYAYRIQYRAILPNVPPTNPWTQISLQSNTTTLINLLCNTNYEWQVQSICTTATNGTSAFSSSSFFTTSACANLCAVPLNLMATNIAPQSCLVKWTSPTPVFGFSIRYRKINTGAWTVVSSNTYSKQLFGLQAQSYYEWQVQSICTTPGGTTAGSVSAWSPSSYFHTHFVIVVGPNPADRLLKVEMELNDTDETAHIQLRNILGAVVFSTEKTLYDGKNELEIATANFTEGLYFLSVSGVSGKQVSKVYVRH